MEESEQISLFEYILISLFCLNANVVLVLERVSALSFKNDGKIEKTFR